MSKYRVVVLKIVAGQLSVAQAAQEYGISRRHLQRLLARYRDGGLEAVDPQSRRPKSKPRSTPPDVVERILQLRGELIARGLDAGPVTIGWHLNREQLTVPLTAAATASRIYYQEGPTADTARSATTTGPRSSHLADSRRALEMPSRSAEDAPPTDTHSDRLPRKGTKANLTTNNQNARLVGTIRGDAEMGSIEATMSALTEPEAERERQHQRRLATTDHVWGSVRLVAIIGGVLVGLGLIRPIAESFAGLTTVVAVSVNIAVAISLVASLTIAGTAVGWALAAKGQKASKLEARRLHRVNRELRAEIEALKRPQPMLETEPSKEG